MSQDDDVDATDDAGDQDFAPLPIDLLPWHESACDKLTAAVASQRLAHGRDRPPQELLRGFFAILLVVLVPLFVLGTVVVVFFGQASAVFGVAPSEPPVWSRSATMMRRVTSESASVTSAK